MNFDKLHMHFMQEATLKLQIYGDNNGKWHLI